jgi:hypothetical protein
MDTQFNAEGIHPRSENARTASPRATHSRKPTQAEKALQPRAAFEQVFERSRALSKKELVVVNIDVPATVRMAMEALPGLRALRSELAELPRFEIENLDLLEAYALALSHAYANAFSSTARLADPAVKLQAIQLRDILLADSRVLVTRGLISLESLKSARVACRKNLPFGLLGLVALLRNEWPKICGWTTVTEAELDTAERVANQLLNQRGERQRAFADVAEIQEQRQRNLTLLVRAYAQLRRAVAYLYWQNGAVDRLAPSLYRGRYNHGHAPRESSSSRREARVQPSLTTDNTSDGSAGQP